MFAVAFFFCFCVAAAVGVVLLLLWLSSSPLFFAAFSADAFKQIAHTPHSYTQAHDGGTLCVRCKYANAAVCDTSDGLQLRLADFVLAWPPIYWPENELTNNTNTQTQAAAFLLQCCQMRI